jgi:predicted dienelactone hydrolase
MMKLKIVAASVGLIVLYMAGCGGTSAPDLDAVVSDNFEVTDIAEELPADPSVPGLNTFIKGTASISVDVDGVVKNIAITTFTPDGAGPVPLVIFNHGFSLEPLGYFKTAEYLASWGMIVVMPQLPGSAFTPVSHRAQAEYLRAVLDWAVGDANAAGGLLAGRVDSEHIGITGHSLGGKLSFLLTSMDDRIDAVFGIDPVDAGPPGGGDAIDWPSVTPEKMNLITVPMVALGANADGGLSDALACSPGDNNYIQYYAAAVSPIVKIEIVGGDHLSFLDECDELCSSFCRPGTDDPAVTRALTQKYLVAFFRQHLFGEAGYRSFLAGRQMALDAAQNLVIAESKNGY